MWIAVRTARSWLAVHSTDRKGRRLPDAVFAFRLGDPQYNYWEEKYLNRMAGKG